MPPTDPSDPRLLTGAITFLFTDIEGSAALWEHHRGAMQVALARHDAILREGIELHGGHVFKTVGDAFCAAFAQPSQALAAALSLQQALLAEVWPTPMPVRVRIALHSGEAQWRHGDYFGPPLNAVARLMSVCRGGQTLLSAATRAALGGTTIAGAQIESHGYYRLKGIEDPVEVAELAAPSAACMPPPDGDKAYRVVRVGELWRPLREVQHNLVPERDAFVGRQAELRRLAERLEGRTRLLTVRGAGGTGKTRLVRRYAMAWLGEWPGGVYFCDLSEARSLEGIHFAVALALGVPLGREDAGLQLGHAIAGRGRCLVILDNFEQVQAHAEATVGRWLDRAEQARFIVTSRERLHVSGEEVFALEPMELTGDAMELFEARARAQQPGFVIDGSNHAVVAQIVQMLDGLPLAVELAAARARVLSPAQIVERMKDRFALLVGVRGAAARQSTLKAVIDWSWDLLAPWEQAALAQCSTFDGGFALEAAEAVLDLSAWADAPPAIDVIQALVDKSLLRAWLPKVSGRLDIAEPFFGMYLSIHEYASQKLRAFGERVGSDVEQRHGRYFAGFGTDQALDALLTHGGVARRRTLALELDNLVGACHRAIRRRQPDLAAACCLAASAVIDAQGPFKLAVALCRQTAALDGLAPRHGALVQIALARALRTTGQIESADGALALALVIARQAHDGRAEAAALSELAVARHREGHIDEAERHFDAALPAMSNERTQRGVLLANLANLRLDQGRMDEARATYEAALALHREVGNLAAEGIALGNLGTLHHELGRAADARAAYDNALIIHRGAGSLLQEAITLYNLGILVHRQGDPKEAAAHYRAALKIHREIGNRRGEGVVLGQIGELHHALGEFELARAHYDEALRIHREVGNLHFEGGVLANLGALLAGRGQVDAGMEALEAGERLLRQLGDPLTLAKLLCVKGGATLAAGNADAARSALAEAQSIGARLGAGPASDLAQQIEDLRRALD